VTVDDAALRARLYRVAYQLGSVMGIWVADAIALAAELVAAGADGEATVAVAALPPGAIRSDAEPLIRQMLSEWAVPFTEDRNSPDWFRVVLAALAHGGISVAEFSGPFYEQLVAWDRQNAMQRELVVLLDRWEAESVSGEREAIAAEMRAAADRWARSGG
jgi:hypothetical protein